MITQLKSLKRFNFVMGCIHVLQGIVILFIASDFALPITGSFLKFNTNTSQLVPNTSTLVQLHIGSLVAGFLFLSAIAHFLLTLPTINDWYNQNLKKGLNLARWMEYSLSSSLMIVVIAMLVGIYDVVSILLIFFLNMTMILFGWMMEVHNQTTTKTDWTAFIFGTLAGAIPWIGIGIYLLCAYDKPPTFVYWIYASIFIFFNSFAINMILQYKKIGKWQDYLYGERAYIILSLVAKSALAWQVFAGTLRP